MAGREYLAAVCLLLAPWSSLASSCLLIHTHTHTHTLANWQKEERWFNVTCDLQPNSRRPLNRRMDGEGREDRGEKEFPASASGHREQKDPRIRQETESEGRSAQAKAAYGGSRRRTLRATDSGAN